MAIPAMAPAESDEDDLDAELRLACVVADAAAVVVLDIELAVEVAVELVEEVGVAIADVVEAGLLMETLASSCVGILS
jgi:hypothetical protein